MSAGDPQKRPQFDLPKMKGKKNTMGTSYIARHHLSCLAAMTIFVSLRGDAPPTQYESLPLSGSEQPATCKPELRPDDPALLTRETRGYFPKEWTSLGLQCNRHCLPLFSPFEREWYSDALAAAGEPSLASASLSDRTEQEQFRFTWLPTFHHPVVVRVTFDAEGGRLDAVELSGSGGYEPGKIGRQIHRPLQPDELVKIRQASAETMLFEFRSVECGKVGIDGSEWLFEKRDANGYHFGNYWAPEKNRARRTGELMLRLTGWKFRKIY
ncbi:hypothetical protein [Novosphingobium sp. ST904]|uniref:hypothetical protein n=1 Tax=Novosphingobium sp. ST904 TaxID=1684385 RepID=UPI000A425F81|nr:hypothetical protein [Novosphingobium sp. ST904]TCM40016.1 hypothetical protein EDF59_105254 [Novosphingobium sp. ST904]